MTEQERYTEELQSMLLRVTERGTPNKEDIRTICSIIFRMQERLSVIEQTIVLDDKPARD